jgi:hypothetical protein
MRSAQSASVCGPSVWSPCPSPRLSWRGRRDELHWDEAYELRDSGGATVIELRLPVSVFVRTLVENSPQALA